MSEQNKDDEMIVSRRKMKIWDIELEHVQQALQQAEIDQREHAILKDKHAALIEKVRDVLEAVETINADPDKPISRLLGVRDAQDVAAALREKIGGGN